jgi:hypothetical protein
MNSTMVVRNCPIDNKTNDAGYCIWPLIEAAA